jgi:prophage tail gpP-like protein
MLTATEGDKVSLRIGGKLHSDWTHYEIDSDLQIPADAWQLELAAQHGQVPKEVREGAAIEVCLGRDVILTGFIDDVEDEVAKDTFRLNLNGRDGASVLLDCSAPVFSQKQMTLAQIVGAIVKPLGISRIRIDAEESRIREKVAINPGDTAWDALVSAAEANGLWPWFDPDGALVIGGPDYSKPPVASLILKKDGKGNNVERLRRARSSAERYSEVTVLGQSHGTSSEAGKHALKSTVKDTSLARYRPKITVDYDADNLSFARSRGRKILSDGFLKALTIVADVKGHRTSDGLLWMPGQRIHVLSEPQGIDGIFFLMGRRFTGGRGRATLTRLTLKADSAWVLDAHPHKLKKKRLKGSTKAGEDVEVFLPENIREAN